MTTLERDALVDRLDGGRGSGEEVLRNVGEGTAGDAGAPHTDERAGLVREDEEIGMVNRRAAGFEEGVEGLVGGTL